MKIPKLFNSYVPSRCCGATTAALLAVGGVSSLMSTVAQSETNDYNVSSQKSENEKNRRFSHDEAELQRYWASSEWSRQYEMQREEWYNQLKSQYGAQWEQFQKQAEYNSPVQQMSRLRDAGLNPSAMLGNQNSGLVAAATGNLSNAGSPSVPTGGSVSGASATAPSSSISPVTSPLSGLMGSFGSLVNDLASAGKTSMTAKATLHNILADTDLKIADKNLKTIVEQYQSIQTEIAKLTKDPMVLKAFAELETEFVDQRLKSAQTHKFDADTLLSKAQQIVVDLEGKIKNEELTKVKFEVAHLADYLALYSKQIEGQYAANMGSAAVSNAQAETISQMRQFVVDNAESVAKMNMLLAAEQGVKTDALLKNNQKFVDAFISNLERSKIITKEEKERLYTMSMDNKQYVLRQICNYLGFLKNLSNPMSSVPAMGIANEEMSSNAGMVDFILNQRPIVRGFAP